MSQIDRNRSIGCVYGDLGSVPCTDSQFPIPERKGSHHTDARMRDGMGSMMSSFIMHAEPSTSFRNRGVGRAVLDLCLEVSEVYSK